MDMRELTATLKEIRAGFAALTPYAYGMRIDSSFGEAIAPGFEFRVCGVQNRAALSGFEALARRAGQLVARWQPSLCTDVSLRWPSGEFVFYALLSELGTCRRRRMPYLDEIEVGSMEEVVPGAVAAMDQLIAAAEETLLTGRVDDLIIKARAAEIADVCEKTIGRWIAAKKLPAYGPDQRVSESELKTLLPQLSERKPRKAGEKNRKRRSGHSADTKRT